jgi:DedD protein
MLKNRVIGSAILVVVAVVFLPDVLDGQKAATKEQFQAVPTRPEFASVTEQAPLNPAAHEAAKAQAQALPVDTDPLPDLTMASTTTDASAANTSTVQDVMADSALPNSAVASSAATGSAVTATAPSDAVKTNKKGQPSQDDAVAIAAQQEADKIAKEQELARRLAEQAQQKLAKQQAAKQAQQTAKTTSNQAENTASAKVAPKTPEEIRQAANESTAALARAVTQRTPQPVSSQSGGNAWVVKAGAFSNETNAMALAAKLRQAGFIVSTRKVVNPQGQVMVSVLVGPELKKERLQQRLPQLQQLANNPALRISTYQLGENN